MGRGRNYRGMEKNIEASRLFRLFFVTGSEFGVIGA